MKKAPITVIEEVNPQKEFTPYVVHRGGGYIQHLECVLSVLADKLAPIFEKYEFDFLLGSHTNQGIEEKIRNYSGGGGVLFGMSQSTDLEKEIRLLNGKGFLRIFLYSDIELEVALLDFAEECKKEIEDLNLSAYGNKLPLLVGSPSWGGDFKVGERLVSSVSLPFEFGYRMSLKPIFIGVDTPRKSEDKELEQRIVDTWESCNFIN